MESPQSLLWTWCRMPQTYRPRRIFSLAEANRTLPLVSRVVGDIVRVHREMLGLHGRARKLVEEGRREQARELHDRLFALASERDTFLRELEPIGCDLKDPAVGLVDFPARRGDRVVLLCWKLGEPEIAFWHELDAGFRGRRPVAGAF